jgi:hypothetical protein
MSSGAMNPISAFCKSVRDTHTPLRSLLLLVVVLSARLSAASYYVDYAGGSDANLGISATAAWKHCPGDSAATGLPAAATLLPGDTVVFKGGVSYVFTGNTGINLRWNGLLGSSITYDGNSSGSWGTGRAKFTDNYGSAAIAAFSASTAASGLTFKNLEISAIGGAASLPADTGSPSAQRLGNGIVFSAGATRVAIENCVFGQLGFAFNQKPMAATSLAGTAITMRGADAVTITNCDFSRMNAGIDLTGAAPTNVTITNCSFHDFVVWPFNLPNDSSGVSISGCSETNNAQFDRTAWTGYGDSPRVTTKTIAAGATVSLVGSAAAVPGANFQWQKNGQVIVGATSSILTLNSVSFTDAGNYSAVASNSAGSTPSHEVVLTVTGSQTTTAPAITTQPVSQTAAQLSSVTFTVAATGTPAPTFQWFRNGTTVAGATASTLTLASVSSTDAGTYVAVATNSAGSATSNGATLTISTSSGTSPSFTTQPVSQTAPANSTVTFTVAASGSPAPTFEWFRNGITFPGWTGATLTLETLSSNDAGSYVAVATNSAGSATSTPATLTIGTAPAGTAPSITTQPNSQTAAALSTVTFTVAATGSPSPTFQWLKNGATLSGATGASLTLPSVTSTDAATYVAVATNSLGAAQSNGAVLTVNAVPSNTVAPLFTLQPVGAATTAKTSVTFKSAASGTPAPTYQWKKDGAAIAGATAASLILSNVNKGSAGTYTVVATNIAGSVVSNAAVLTIGNARAASATLADGTTSAAASSQLGGEISLGSRLANLSVRAVAGSGNDSLIVGFVVGGNSNKSLLIRGSGPVLSTFGVPGVLADPTLALYSGAKLLAANDDWSTSDEASEISAAGREVGAFTLPEESRDSALLANVAPGAYTGQITGKQSATGTALIELFDASPDTETRLVNVSVRTVVTSNGAAPTIGFVVTGTEPKTLLIRAVGPSLEAYGVTGTLSNPQLDIYEGAERLQQNDGWAGSAELKDVFAQVGAFPFGDSASKDAALLFTAAPGAYTAVVSSGNNASGTVLVEVYEVQ